MKKDETTFRKLVGTLYELCDKNSWGDPFASSRSKEILMACELGHRVAPISYGADAFDKRNNGVEYKSTTAKSICGTYNTISRKSSWQRQVKFITFEKIGKYKYHFFARFVGPKIVEIWRVRGKDLVPIIIEKIKKPFFSKKVKSDPRLKCLIDSKIIKKIGVKIK